MSNIDGISVLTYIAELSFLVFLMGLAWAEDDRIWAENGHCETLSAKLSSLVNPSKQ